MIRDYLLLIPILILTVVMGYVLGIMVSSTVDYRLKDIVVNLPRPKTNVFLNDKIVTTTKPKINKHKNSTDTHLEYKVKSSKVKSNIINEDKPIIDNQTEKEIDGIKEKVESFTSIINTLTNKIYACSA